MHDHGHSLVLAFDTNAPEFARGVEIGRLWEQLRATDDAVDQLVHVTNAEMALRVAEACQRRVTSEEHDETWMTVHFSVASAAEAEASR